MTLRAFDIKADTDNIISLIREAFHYPDHEQWNLSTEEMTSIVDDFQTMRTLYPVFKIGGLFYPILKSIMQGYIWEEDGHAVGLVNVSPHGLDNQTWVIGNVAVHPDYRRKGIARKLIEATINLTRQQQIKHVILEVIADNVPAVKLYESMGFEIYSTVVQLNRDATLPQPLTLPEGYMLAPYHDNDWQSAYRLMQTITPVHVQNYEPITARKFQKSLFLRMLRSLIMLFAPMKSLSYMARYEASGAPVARFTTYPRRKAGGINEISIDLHSDHALLAPYIVNRCISDILRASPERELELRIPRWQANVLQAAYEAGFSQRAEWHMMGMHLTPA